MLLRRKLQRVANREKDGDGSLAVVAVGLNK